MMVAIVIVLALAAVNLFFLYRHSMRDSLAINEYVQFLLLHPDIYADHRGKFEAYLQQQPRPRCNVGLMQ